MTHNYRRIMEERDELTSDQHQTCDHKIVEKERFNSAKYSPCIIETCSAAFQSGTDKEDQKSGNACNESGEDLVSGSCCLYFTCYVCQEY